MKPGDNLIINTNKTRLLECSQTIRQLKLKVNEEDEHIYSADDRRPKTPECSLHHTSYLDILKKLLELKCKINQINEKLEGLLVK